MLVIPSIKPATKVLIFNKNPEVALLTKNLKMKKPIIKTGIPIPIFIGLKFLVNNSYLNVSFIGLYT